MDEDNEISHPWQEYRRLILTELKSLNDNILRLTDKVDNINSNHLEEMNKLDKRVVILETKAGIIGGLGGIVCCGVIELIKYLAGGT